MTDTKAPTEPTMEEILASIRRIISENDEEQDAKARIEGTPASPAPVVAAAAAVLELTDMVTEDGTVVSLTAGSPDEVVDAEIKDEDIEDEVKDEFVAEALPNSQTDEIEVSVDQADSMEVTMENPKDDSVEFAAPHEPTQQTGASMDDGLVSAATAAAATATFAQLARTLSQEPATAGNMALGSGRTLEDLVKEMLRPMLKEWLDKNLPPMVEHMVRRELDRMTRRAGDV
jgi:cell pole-organizing protein PopZ